MYDHAPAASDYQIQQAQAEITAKTRAAILARVNSKNQGQPQETKPSQLNQEIKQAHKNNPASFPRAAVTAAVRAADVLMPQELERRTIIITEMYLKKLPVEQIAATLKLDVETVRIEIKRIDQGRAVAFQHNPDLALKLAEKHFDVMAETLDWLEEDGKLLDAIDAELYMDHELAKEAFLARSDSQEAAFDPQAGQGTQKAPRKGMSPLKIQARFQARDIMGKQLDRVATILGLLGKHVTPSTNHTVVNNIQFGNDKLNAVADAFMAANNHTIANLYAQPQITAPQTNQPTESDIIDAMFSEIMTEHP